MPENKFFNLKKKENGVAVLNIYGEIAESNIDFWTGEPDESIFSSISLKKELDELEDVNELQIFINSPGGEVFAGQAIYSVLKRYPAKKVVYIDGIAASIASVIALAGDEIIMPKNSMIMIHKAMTSAFGNSEDLLKVAETLERVESSIIAVYKDKTGLEESVLKDWMSKETWFTAEEAVKYGFANKIEETKKIFASLDANNKLNINNLVIERSKISNFEELKTKLEIDNSKNIVKNVDKGSEKNNNKVFEGKNSDQNNGHNSEETAVLADDIKKFIKMMEE